MVGGDVLSDIVTHIEQSASYTVLQYTQDVSALPKVNDAAAVVSLSIGTTSLSTVHVFIASIFSVMQHVNDDHLIDCSLTLALLEQVNIRVGEIHIFASLVTKCCCCSFGTLSQFQWRSWQPFHCISTRLVKTSHASREFSEWVLFNNVPCGLVALSVWTSRWCDDT